MEKLSRKVISQPIYTVAEGEQLGHVKNLVFDPVNKEIVAIVIDQKGWFKETKIIPYGRVKHIGDDAVTVDKSGTAEKPANLPYILKLLKNPTNLINTKVVTTKGKNLGKVEEFWFDIETGKITKLEISGGMLEGLLKGKAAICVQDVTTIGKDVVIVADGAEERLEVSEKNLHNTLYDIKTATTKAWGTTVSTTRKWGQSISTSLGKLADEEKDQVTKVEEKKDNTIIEVQSAEDILVAKQVEEQPTEDPNRPKAE